MISNMIAWEKIIYQKLAKNLSDKERRENFRGKRELYEAPKASISVLLTVE